MGKVLSQGDLILHTSEWKRNGKSVVFVAGTFDLLHPGHVRLLEQARELGDLVVVGVASDAAVRELQAAAGERGNKLERPITPAAERMEILAALEAVDFAVEFDEPAPSKLIAQLNPEFIVEGAVGGRGAKLRQPQQGSSGPRVHAIPLEPGYSTTELIKRIKQIHA